MMPAGLRPEANRTAAIVEPPEAASLRAEIHALRAQLSLRDNALDGTPSFFVITKLEDPVPVIVYCNKFAAQQHGYVREELIGKPITVLAQWVGRNPNYIEDVRTALRRGQTFHYEDEVTRQDGSTFWIGVSIRPLCDDQGRLTHAVAVGADITAKLIEAKKKQELQDKLVAEMEERQRMVIELQLAQKLESVGRLAAGIAHEINTPIQYVGDSAYFLKSAVADLQQLTEVYRAAVEALFRGESPRIVRANLTQIDALVDKQFIDVEIPQAFARTLEGVERVTSIVRAMKEFAHPDAQEQSPADINHAIETTLLVSRNEYKYHACVDTELGELPAAVCNVNELNQVFLNLIVNAAHAIESAGRDASSGVISIRTRAVEESVEILIEDNGCGIPRENLDRVFDPFFTTKEIGKGTGQGLAIARSVIVEKHNGTIDFETAEGKGTTFIIRLPHDGKSLRSAAGFSDAQPALAGC